MVENMNLKKILLFGAGKSASVLIDFLINESSENGWETIIVDADKNLIDKKISGRSSAIGIGMDINDESQRAALIKEAAIVISMMPPSLHILIARDCINFGKSLLTASYADESIKSLEGILKEKGILFLCEMGLDPGIDHMSAMKIIDDIKEKGGKITAFKSHCGGLVAPESDHNPWHYKISWNPRNVVLAGKAGALYRLDKVEIDEHYEELFNADRTVNTIENLNFAFYPNRNSLSYIDLYQLPDVETFVRTTLRYKNFISGWKHIVHLKLTDETPTFHSDGKSLQDFYQAHFEKNNINLNDFFNDISEPQLFEQQLNYLGHNDNSTFINKGFCSAADVMQFALENKLVLEKR
jgi:saccharopine dehydrogenase-like NADP-dependent oxidoreductase